MGTRVSEKVASRAFSRTCLYDSELLIGTTANIPLGAFIVLELEYPRVIEGQIFKGVPRARSE